MGGTGFSAPRPGWSAPGQRGAGGGELCLSLPPLPSCPCPFPLTTVLSPPLLLRALPHQSFPPGLWPPLSPGPQFHSQPSGCESLAKTGARCTGHQSWKGAPQRPPEQSSYCPGNTTEGLRGEGSASDSNLTVCLHFLSRSLHVISPLLYGPRKAPSKCPHPLCSSLPLFSPFF